MPQTTCLRKGIIHLVSLLLKKMLASCVGRESLYTCMIQEDFLKEEGQRAIYPLAIMLVGALGQRIDLSSLI